MRRHFHTDGKMVQWPFNDFGILAPFSNPRLKSVSCPIPIPRFA